MRLMLLRPDTCENTNYSLTGGPDQVYLTGLPDGEWLALEFAGILTV
jgi:hypothetical protein